MLSQKSFLFFSFGHEFRSPVVQGTILILQHGSREGRSDRQGNWRADPLSANTRHCCPNYHHERHDWLKYLYYSYHMYSHTIPIHFHSCHKNPMHLVSLALQLLFYYLNFFRNCRVIHSHKVFRRADQIHHPCCLLQQFSDSRINV